MHNNEYVCDLKGDVSRGIMTDEKAEMLGNIYRSFLCYLDLEKATLP